MKCTGSIHTPCVLSTKSDHIMKILTAYQLVGTTLGRELLKSIEPNSEAIPICASVVVVYAGTVRATLPPSMLFADRALLYRGYSISEPNALVEAVSKYKGLH